MKVSEELMHKKLDIIILASTACFGILSTMDTGITASRDFITKNREALAKEFAKLNEIVNAKE